MLWLLALLARADVRVVGDHCAQEASKLQLLEQTWHLYGVLAVLACAAGRIVGDHGAHGASELQLLKQRLPSRGFLARLPCANDRSVSDHGAQEAQVATSVAYAAPVGAFGLSRLH